MTTTEKLSHEEFTNNLEQFIGSMHFYPIAFTPLIFTDGIRYFAETCECFWLVDLIGYGLYKVHKQLGTLFIDIEVNKRHTVHITARQDSGMPVIFEKKQKDICKVIPIGTYKFYLMNGTLLLPSEY